MIDWKITERGFYPEKIAFNGTKFLIANGYMGVRGTLEEFTKDQLVAVNLAGLYDQVGNGWRESVNAPNGFFTYLIVDEEICRLPECEPSEHSVSLDYRKGIFSRKTTWKTPRGSLTVNERFESLAQPHLALMKYKICPIFADIELITVLMLMSGYQLSHIAI